MGVAQRHEYDPASHSTLQFQCCVFQQPHVKCPHKAFISLTPKHIVTIFGTPFKVVEILAYAMATAH